MITGMTASMISKSHPQRPQWGRYQPLWGGLPLVRLPENRTFAVLLGPTADRRTLLAWRYGPYNSVCAVIVTNSDLRAIATATAHGVPVPMRNAMGLGIPFDNVPTRAEHATSILGEPEKGGRRSGILVQAEEVASYGVGTD